MSRLYSSVKNKIVSLKMGRPMAISLTTMIHHLKLLLSLVYFISIQTGCNNQLQTSNLASETTAETNTNDSNSNDDSSSPPSLGNSFSENTDCKFDSRIVKNGKSVVAFNMAKAYPPEICRSEVRICRNGNLTGSFAYGSCSNVSNGINNPGGGNNSDSNSHNSGTITTTTIFKTPTSSTSSTSSTSTTTTLPTTTSTTLQPPANNSSFSYGPVQLVSHSKSDRKLASDVFAALPMIDAAGVNIVMNARTDLLVSNTQGSAMGGVLYNFANKQGYRIASVGRTDGRSSPCDSFKYDSTRPFLATGSLTILFDNCVAQSPGNAAQINFVNSPTYYGIHTRISPDGNYLVYFHYENKNIYLLNRSSQAVIKVNETSSGQNIDTNFSTNPSSYFSDSARALVVSQNGMWVGFCGKGALGSEVAIYLKNTITQQIYSAGLGLCDLSLSKDGRKLVYSNLNGSSVIYDYSTGQKETISFSIRYEIVHFSSVTSDGKYICGAAFTNDSGFRKDEIFVYDIQARQTISTGKVFSEIYSSLSCSDDAKVIVFDTTQTFPDFNYPKSNLLQVYAIVRE